METVLDRVPVDRIEAEAREIEFGRTVLTLFAGVFFVVGWSVGKLWRGVAWAAAAVKVGWQEGRAATRSPRS